MNNARHTVGLVSPQIGPTSDSRQGGKQREKDETKGWEGKQQKEWEREGDIKGVFNLQILDPGLAVKVVTVTHLSHNLYKNIFICKIQFRNIIPK